MKVRGAQKQFPEKHTFAIEKYIMEKPKSFMVQLKTTDYKTYHCYIENSDFAKLQIGCITSDNFQLYMDGLTEKYARNTYKKMTSIV